MQALLESLTSALSTDPILTGFAVAWMSVWVWGATVVLLAYCSRIRERAVMVNPPRHPLFPSFRGKRDASSN
jgi:hypothetical protein